MMNGIISIMMAITVFLSFIAMVRILLFRERLFILFKIVVVLTMLSMLFKALGVMYGCKFFTRIYLFGTMVGMSIFIMQLNRLSFRSLAINYINATLVVASVFEIALVPDNMIDPVCTILPIRNAIMTIISVEVFILASILVIRIHGLKAPFGKLVKWEEKFSTALIVETGIFMGISITFLHSLFHLLPKEMAIFNIIAICLIAIMLVHIVFIVSSTPFFVAFSGVEAIAVILGGVKVAEIGHISNNIIVALEKTQASMIRAVLRDKILIYWRSTIKAGGSIRKLSLIILGWKYEEPTERFFNILSMCIRDRISRDYILAEKLMDIDTLIRQIESPIPPRFLGEEFTYALRKFRDII